MIGEWKGSRKLLRKHEALQNGVGHALATPTSEWKRVHQDGANLLVEFLAHEFARAMKPGLHRVRRKIKEVRGFLGAHALNHARHEHDSKDLGQIIGRPPDKLQNFPLRHSS